MASRGVRISRVRVLHPQEEKRWLEHLKRLHAERAERRAKSEDAARLAARDASQMTTNRRRRRAARHRGSNE